MNTNQRLTIRLVKRIAKLLGMDNFDAEVERLQKMPREDVEKEFRDLWPLPLPSDYREIPWGEESPRIYAYKVLATMLPKFENRDKAMEALALVYPYQTRENVLLKIAGALYFTRRDA